LRNFRTLHSAPTDFEVPIKKGTSKAPIYEIGGTGNYTGPALTNFYYNWLSKAFGGAMNARFFDCKIRQKNIWPLQRGSRSSI
jgi:hypothetical protein